MVEAAMASSDKASRYGLDHYWCALRSDPRLVQHASLYVWAAGLFGTGWVLDVGCEYGFGSFLMANANAALRVVGCDGDLSALGFARDNLAHSHVAVCQALADTLPLANGSVSGVCLFNILHLVSYPVAVLEEVRRVLKDGHPVVITLPPAESLPTAWHDRSPVERLSGLVGHVFARIEFPTKIVACSPLLPAGEQGVGGPHSMTVAVCRSR